MITPAYNVTATERVLPRMALDFTTGVLDPRVTITRALDTATRVNSSGFVEIVTANLPRFDYSPTTLSPKGLLIEESRTNLMLRSDDFGSGSWTKNGVTIIVNTTTSPDGTVNADTIDAPIGGAGAPRVAQRPAITGGTTYTISSYFKASGTNFAFLSMRTSGANWAGAEFDLSTGTVTRNAIQGNVAYVGATISSAGDGWYRCTLTVTPTDTVAAGVGFIFFGSSDGTSAFAGGYPSFTNVGTETVFIWGAQHEAGAFATSYIPTTTTSLTRNADNVSMTGTNFSDWYNASEGTFNVSASLIGQKTSFRAILAASDSTSLTYIGILQASNGYSIRGNVLDNNIGQATLTLGTSANGANLSASLAYKADSFAGSLNGANPVADVSGVVPTVSELSIGYWGAAAPNTCHIKKISYWPQRLTNAEVQAFSK